MTKIYIIFGLFTFFESVLYFNQWFFHQDWITDYNPVFNIIILILFINLLIEIMVKWFT